MRRFLAICLLLGAVVWGGQAYAQHTLGVTGGYGSGTARFYPEQETRSIWGCYTAGVTWRYYGPQRFVGGFGVDFEFLQRGFSYAPNVSKGDDPSTFKWYTRRVNSLVLPIVWQPHIYLLKNRMRVFLDLSVYFSYNISSTYVNDYARAQYEAAGPGSPQYGKPWRGEYDFKVARDNRWGYGLAGGGGFAVLVDRLEFSLRVRYYFGYSDLLRNRNKYAGNTTDIASSKPAENPFTYTPLRSPLDNLTFTVGISYRFNKGGFTEWSNHRHKREKVKESFDYKGQTKK